MSVAKISNPEKQYQITKSPKHETTKKQAICLCLLLCCFFVSPLRVRRSNRANVEHRSVARPEAPTQTNTRMNVFDLTVMADIAAATAAATTTASSPATADAAANHMNTSIHTANHIDTNPT